MPKTLIIGGCARSGTTGFRSILARDERMAIGLERYLKLSIGNKLTPDLWERDRFCNVRPEDTHVQPQHSSWAGAQVTLEHARLNYENLAYIGDKLPRSGNNYSSLAISKPDTKILYMLRNPFDVAASYNKRAQNEKDKGWRSSVNYKTAIDHWNLDVSETVKYYTKFDIHIIRYESIFRSAAEFESVYQFLNLPLTDTVREIWGNSRRKSLSLEESRSALNDMEKVYICANADFDSYKELLSMGNYLDK